MSINIKGKSPSPSRQLVIDWYINRHQDNYWPDDVYHAPSHPRRK